MKEYMRMVCEMESYFMRVSMLSMRVLHPYARAALIVNAFYACPPPLCMCCSYSECAALIVNVCA